jgi:hypothetical protein
MKAKAVSQKEKDEEGELGKIWNIAWLERSWSCLLETVFELIFSIQEEFYFFS